MLNKTAVINNVCLIFTLGIDGRQICLLFGSDVIALRAGDAAENQQAQGVFRFALQSVRFAAFQLVQPVVRLRQADQNPDLLLLKASGGQQIDDRSPGEKALVHLFGFQQQVRAQQVKAMFFPGKRARLLDALKRFGRHRQRAQHFRGARVRRRVAGIRGGHLANRGRRFILVPFAEPQPR